MKANTSTQRVSALIIACIIMASMSMAQTIDLTLTVKGIQGNSGNIMIGIGDTRNPQDMKGSMIKVSGDIATTQIKEVPQGECTIYTFHDMNGNYQLDRDEKGKPKEGCAITKATVDEQNNMIEVVLYYGKEK